MGFHVVVLDRDKRLSVRNHGSEGVFFENALAAVKECGALECLDTDVTVKCNGEFFLWFEGGLLQADAEVEGLPRRGVSQEYRALFGAAKYFSEKKGVRFLESLPS